MRADFWNNPLIVSAFRVKNRRGGLFNLAALYIMVLVAGGMVLDYYNDRIGGTWSRNYLLALLGVQFFISGLFAISATATSVRNEVTSRTFDFQRIAALSPRQILLGKLLGEPAVAYMLAFATIPLAAWCFLLGVEGVSLDVLVLIYVNLFTTTVLSGSLGMLQRIDAPAGKGGNPGMGALWILLPFALIPPVMGNPMLLTRPWTLAPVGLIMPIPLFVGIRQGDPWHYCLLFYGLQVPLLVATPVFQVGAAFHCFNVMERRLVNPLNTHFSKTTAYLVLLAIDIVAGGVFLQRTPLGLDLVERVGAFALVHLAVSVWLITMVTPWRESLESWVWRLRGRRRRFWDLWLGERSENILTLVTFALIGVACAVVGVILPFRWQEGFGAAQDQLPVIVSTLGIMTVLILSLGTLYQLLAAVLRGRTGLAVLFCTILLVLTVPAHIVGYYYHIDWLRALAPSAQFAAWFTKSAPPSPWPLLGLYGLMLIGSWLALRRWVTYLERNVDRKLHSMGVGKLASNLASGGC
jgi:hypothetical protein